jgi:hypothetical protein
LIVDVELVKESYLQFKFGEHVTKYKIKVDNKKKQQSLNMIRVHYFFSFSKDIGKMLKSEQITLRITEDQSWDNVIFEGRSLMLSEFHPDYLSYKSIILPKISYLFTTNRHLNISLQSIIGLTFDSTIDSSLVNLYKSEYGTYYTDDSFCASYPMPDAWVSVLGERRSERKETEPYIPVLPDKVIAPDRNSIRKLFDGARSQSTKESEKRILKKPLTQRSIKEIKVPVKKVVIRKRRVKTPMDPNKRLVIAVTKDLMEDNSEPTIETFDLPVEREERQVRSPYETKPQKKEQKKAIKKPRTDLQHTGIMFI